jgi:type IV pilus assembly protein PilM
MGKGGRNVLQTLAALLREPPPAYAFEFSESGIAGARTGRAPAIEFRPLPPGAIVVSPVKDNVVMPDELALAFRALAPGDSRRHNAALILPDYAARLSVLDFDQFPGEARELQSLVRFRVKKSVPYDVDSAALSYWVQPRSGRGKVDVVVAVCPLETVSRFEAPARLAGFNPGLVPISALCALRLVAPEGVTVLAKLSGRVLTIAVLEESRVRMIRCLELPSAGLGDVAADLYPTFVYIEVTVGSRVRKLVLHGFGGYQEAAQRFAAELKVEVEPLRSPFGPPAVYNAGLLGYLAQ